MYPRIKKNNFKHILYICFVFYGFSLFAQNIKGVIVDAETNKPISNANVQLLDIESNETIDYVVTGKDGKFVFRNEKQISKVKVKTTFFGYEPSIKEVALPMLESLIIKLKVKINKLDEVVLKSDFKEFRVKKDTISYNLKGLRDSTEVNLEDLIKKLPGLEINDNGKIEYKNKEIDKVLIDGNEFFGNKHQMATKNLPANAIDGLELLTNHQGFESVKGFENKGKIVLNVKLKNSFKGKIVGNIEGNYGVVDKYLAHLNAFKFFKGGNLSFVSDYNNIGETAITINDYIELRGGISAFSDDADQSVVKIDDSEFPSYVLANNLAEKREVGFNSLNYTHTFSKKLKLVSYSILNDSKLFENRITEKDFFNSTTVSLNETIRNESDNFLSSTYASLSYKPNESLSVRYQLNVNSTNDEDNEVVLNTDPNFNSFSNFLKNKSFSFGNTLDFTKRLNDQWLLSSNLYQNHISSDGSLNLESDKNFLGLDINLNDFQLNQLKNVKENSLSWKGGLRYKKSKGQSFDLSVGVFNQNTSFDSKILGFSEFTNDIRMNLRSVRFDLKGSTRINKGIRLGYGLKSNFYQTEYNSTVKKVNRFLPSLSINFDFLTSNQLSLGYSKNVDFIGLYDLIENRFVESFRKIIGLSNLTFNNPIDINKFNINYFNINPKKNFILTSSFTYQIEKNGIGYNVTYDTNFINESSIRVPENEHFSGILSISKRLKEFPIKIKSTFYYDQIRNENRVETMRNKMKIEQFLAKIELQSVYKQKDFQFRLGMNYKNTSFSQEVNNLSSKLNNFDPYVEFRGLINKNITWKLETIFEKQSTNNENNRFYVLNPKIQYSLKNDRIQIHLKGYNILNLRNNELLSQSLNQSYFQTSRVSLIRGYIIVGVRYSF